MSIFDKMVNRLNNATEKKTFCEKVDYLKFIYGETHKIISVFNNIYWCFYLNVNYEEPLPRNELMMLFAKFSSYISQIISSHIELNKMYNINKSVGCSCVNEFNNANKLCNSMISDLNVLINNYKSMNRECDSERNKLILKNLEQALSRLQQYVNMAEQSKDVITTV